jgi:hypothetical protein
MSDVNSKCFHARTLYPTKTIKEFGKIQTSTAWGHWRNLGAEEEKKKFELFL